MSWQELFLFCFVAGSLWAVLSLALGGLHIGHGGHAHAHVHTGHGSIGRPGVASRTAALVNPSSFAVFLAWFGGAGYLLTHYSGLLLWLNLLLSLASGTAGAFALASFLHFLQSRERPLDPIDNEMVGVLGHVSSVIRPGGIGEVLYVREGSRRCVPARSEDGIEIERGREVIVTQYDRGVAHVRTWEAMIQSGPHA